MNAFTPLLIALVFNLLDIVTGLVSAIKNGELQSAKLRDGLFKKVGFIFCYILSWLVDAHGSDVGFELSVNILPIIILYVCTTETVSIIENISKINPDVLPEKLMEMFHITDNER